MRVRDDRKRDDADAQRDQDTAFHIGGVLGVLHDLGEDGDVAILRGITDERGCCLRGGEAVIQSPRLKC